MDYSFSKRNTYQEMDKAGEYGLSTDQNETIDKNASISILPVSLPDLKKMKQYANKYKSKALMKKIDEIEPYFLTTLSTKRENTNEKK